MTLLQQAQKADDNSQRGFGGWLVIVAAQIPTLLWTLLTWWMFQETRVRMLPQLPPDSIDRATFYGLSIGVFELCYAFTGYGLLSIPLAIILLIVLI